MSCAAAPCLGAELRDVLRRGALLALHDVELDALALGQALEPLGLNGRVMDEAVLLAPFGGDEAETLRVVEPLHGAGGTHCLTPCVPVIGGRQGRTDRLHILVNVPHERVATAQAA